LQIRLQLLHLFHHLIEIFRQFLRCKRKHLAFFFLDMVLNLVDQLSEFGVKTNGYRKRQGPPWCL